MRECGGSRRGSGRVGAAGAAVLPQGPGVRGCRADGVDVPCGRSRRRYGRTCRGTPPMGLSRWMRAWCCDGGWRPQRVLRLPARRPTQRVGTSPPSPVVCTTLRAIQPVRVQPVAAEERPAWSATMTAYHPLSFRRAFRTQQKDWIREEATGERRVLGASGCLRGPRRRWRCGTHGTGWASVAQPRSAPLSPRPTRWTWAHALLRALLTGAART
jgi:hypothetical protein